MECQQAVISMSKYVAQAKDLINKYLDDSICCRRDPNYLDEAITLLNLALENVIV